MRKTTKFAPINSLVFISDINGGEPPIPIRGQNIWFTQSCVAVPCYPEIDGPTEIVLQDASDAEPGGRPAFEGVLETPTRTLVVTTVDDNVLLSSDTSNVQTRLRIWLSDPHLPEVVTIVIG